MEFKVRVKESSFITPSQAMPPKSLWLSPLDLLLANRGHTPLVHLYHADASATAFLNVDRLKDALAKALVAFYPLAGRLSVDAAGRTEISCNSEGVLFTVAVANFAADDFDFKPSQELRRIFVPQIEPASIILATQVTFLKCGGVALGTAVHHAAVDGISMFHFLQTWSSLCRNGAGAAVELPCHDRTLLHPRSPPVVHPDALAVLFPKVTFSEPLGPTATQVYTISKNQVATLKRICGGVSTFCSVSALVWQCTCVARRLPPDARARLSFPANVRRSLRPPLPDRYFGNALVWLGTTGSVRNIASDPLASVAGRIAGALAKMDDEVVRSAVDYAVLAEIDRRPLKGSMPETDIRITSWLGMPLYDAHFGWGRPSLMSRAESVRGGFVYLMDDGSGAVRVVMCMEEANIGKFERLLYANVAKEAKL